MLKVYKEDHIKHSSKGEKAIYEKRRIKGNKTKDIKFNDKEEYIL
jgi:hypothetical protein